MIYIIKAVIMDNTDIKETGTLIPVAPGFWMAPLKSGEQGDMRFVVVPCDGVFMVREGLSYRVLKNISNNIR